MGSIPVRSTRNSRVIKYVGCFFMSFRSENRTMVRPPVRRARPFCHSILRISDISPVIGGIYPSGVPENGECSLVFVVFFAPFLMNPPSVRNSGRAIFLPRDFRLRKTANSSQEYWKNHNPLFVSNCNCG